MAYSIYLLLAVYISLNCIPISRLFNTAPTCISTIVVNCYPQIIQHEQGLSPWETELIRQLLAENCSNLFFWFWTGDTIRDFVVNKHNLTYPNMELPLVINALISSHLSVICGEILFNNRFCSYYPYNLGQFNQCLSTICKQRHISHKDEPRLSLCCFLRQNPWSAIMSFKIKGDIFLFINKNKFLCPESLSTLCPAQEFPLQLFWKASSPSSPSIVIPVIAIFTAIATLIGSTVAIISFTDKAVLDLLQRGKSPIHAK